MDDSFVNALRLLDKPEEAEPAAPAVAHEIFVGGQVLVPIDDHVLALAVRDERPERHFQQRSWELLAHARSEQKVQ